MAAECQEEHYPLLAGRELCSASVVLISVTTDALSPKLSCSCDQLHTIQCALAVAYKVQPYITVLEAMQEVSLWESSALGWMKVHNQSMHR